MGTERLKPIEAANCFINKRFPDCQGAILAGSVVRGQATETSDLDIVVFDDSVTTSYRESLIDLGWPIELFVHSLTSYQYIFQIDYLDGVPTMQRMIAEGLILKDKGMMESIKEEAKSILELGPEKWTDEIPNRRYFITDVLDDFIGSNNRAEDLFIANRLADQLQEFILRANGRWVGRSKWVIRSLRLYDEKLTEDFVEAFDLFYKTGEKSKIIELTDNVLEPYGGRLFEGFSIGR
ncbi:nucleotidyltransferase domain-containing protein [Neobacillus terrae]|uniref:nucleotidyltransferase domain-containing protein n=1 Tax=Neobacillus terrae TaxID=3034837 RepID=UPI00140C9B80|nr:nucleotidyltransferase domain-containing protein [Neobacillus terrae]NHM33087.1 nucleotidyltransferase domain-containing protein [Neobacillus terrae]